MSPQHSHAVSTEAGKADKKPENNSPGGSSSGTTQSPSNKVRINVHVSREAKSPGSVGEAIKFAKYKPEDEQKLRKILNNAKVSVRDGESGEGNKNKDDDGEVQMASVITQLTQLLAVVGMGKETVVRAMAYMRAGDAVHPNRAVGLAKRDRRIKSQLRQAHRKGSGEKTQVVITNEKVGEGSGENGQVKIDSDKATPENTREINKENAIDSIKGSDTVNNSAAVNGSNTPEKKEADVSIDKSKVSENISPKGTENRNNYRRKTYGKGRKFSGQNKKKADSRTSSATSTATHNTATEKHDLENGTNVNGTNGIATDKVA